MNADLHFLGNPSASWLLGRQPAARLTSPSSVSPGRDVPSEETMTLLTPHLYPPVVVALWVVKSSDRTRNLGLNEEQIQPQSSRVACNCTVTPPLLHFQPAFLFSFPKTTLPNILFLLRLRNVPLQTSGSPSMGSQPLREISDDPFTEVA